ncbi:MAG: hypothetical protein M1170_01735 [Patescibacteria group bacterium]|nr:hypothetical protein [Patescibacteria group bacterium]
MKKIAAIGFVCLIVLVVGCAAHFGNEAQYEKGDWYFLAGSQEVAKIQSDKASLAHNKTVSAMAIDKLKSQPIETKIVNGATQGYKGIIHNLSYERANIIITGPEKKSYFLGAKEKIEDFLLPGKYCAETYVGGRKMGKGWIFSVGVPQYNYLGHNVHWYVYYDPNPSN